MAILVNIRNSSPFGNQISPSGFKSRQIPDLSAQLSGSFFLIPIIYSVEMEIVLRKNFNSHIFRKSFKCCLPFDKFPYFSTGLFTENFPEFWPCISLPLTRSLFIHTEFAFAIMAESPFIT